MKLEFLEVRKSLVVRHVGVNWLLFLIGHLYVIGVWYSEDQRIKFTRTTRCVNQIGPCLRIILSTPHAHYTDA